MLENIAAKPYKISLILLLAFFLRMYGLDFGLPYVFHDDEHQYVEAGITFLESDEAWQASLEKLNNPPLFKRTLGYVYLIYSRLLIPDSQEIQTVLTDEQWRTFFHYIGRFTSVAASLLTVALTYALGTRLYHSQVGLLGALLLAVSFLSVRESHFAVNDTPLAFLVMATLYAGAGILRYGRWFDYLLTGLLIGLAGATKYTGVYLGVILFAAHILRHYPFSVAKGLWSKIPFHQPLPLATGREPQRWAWLTSPRWWSGWLLIPLGFALGAPVVLTAWAEMFRRMGRLAEYGRLGYHDLLLAPSGGWIFYLQTLAWGSGGVLFSVCLLAIVVALWYRSAADLLLVCFPLLLFFTMGQQEMVFVRFILPALAPLLPLGAAWVVRVSYVAPRWHAAFTPRRTLATIITLSLIQPLIWSLWFGVLLARPDTRQRVADWLEANVAAGSVVYAEVHALPRESVLGRVEWPYVQLKDLPFDTSNPLDYYQERGVQFIVASDYHHQRIFTDPAQEQGRQQWLATLADLPVIQEFQPYWLAGQWFVFDQRYGPWQETPLRQQPGPTIRVYAVDSPATLQRLNPLAEANQISGKAAVYGYELDSTANIANGEPLAVVLYWLNEGWQPADELVVSLVDEAGFEITQGLAQPMGMFAEELQQGQKIIKSEAALNLPAGTPPGLYQLQVRVKNRDTLQTVGKIVVGQFILDQPILSLTEDEVARFSTAPRLAPDIQLLSAKLAVEDETMHNTLVLGQKNWLVLLWRAESDISVAYTVQVSLSDSQDNVLAVWEEQPLHNGYGTHQWQTGQIVQDPWDLTLPENFTPNEAAMPYNLIVTVRDPEQNVVGVQDLGQMQISGHVRSSAIPAMQTTLDATWPEAFTLLGFNVRAIPDSVNSGWLELDLFWQSLGSVDVDYTVGIRLVNASGQVILLQESEPSAGQKPTTGWQPGEVIHDFRSIRYEELTLGETYTLELVLSNPHTGQPWAAQGAGESLLLTSWP